MFDLSLEEKKTVCIYSGVLVELDSIELLHFVYGVLQLYIQC